MAVLDNIKNLLEEFVKNGGNVNDLKPGNKIYDYIKDAKILGENGKKLTIDEKFKQAGFPRDPLYYLREKVRSGASRYLESGGGFHVERKTLPFYNDLKSYVRAYKKEHGRDISYDDAMKELGFSTYSTIYYKYSHIIDLSAYQDQEGFVDSYRKDEVMKSYIHQASRQLNVPIAVIVALIGDQNLKKYSLDVDFLEETRNEILRELEQARTKATFSGVENIDEVKLEKLSETNRKLYNRLIYLKRRMISMLGSDVTYDDVMYMLDLDSDLVGFKKVYEKKFDIETVMSELNLKAKSQGNKLYRRDIPNSVYRDIVRQSLKHGCYTKDLFKMYDIDYVDGSNNERFKRFTVDEYPYLNRMRSDRDKFMKEFFAKNKNASQEEAFEAYFKTCLAVYEAYKDKIFTFDIDEKVIDEDLIIE